MQWVWLHRGFPAAMAQVCSEVVGGIEAGVQQCVQMTGTVWGGHYEFAFSGTGASEAPTAN